MREFAPAVEAEREGPMAQKFGMLDAFKRDLHVNFQNLVIKFDRNETENRRDVNDGTSEAQLLKHKIVETTVEGVCKIVDLVKFNRH